MLIAGLIVTATGLGLSAFAPLALIAPDHARRFLRGFAGSAYAHYFEVTARLIAGASFIVFSSAMHFAEIFRWFGWLIVVTSVAMLLIPWRWHQRFAERVIPIVIRFLPLYALASLGLGAFILYGALG